MYNYNILFLSRSLNPKDALGKTVSNLLPELQKQANIHVVTTDIVSDCTLNLSNIILLEEKYMIPIRIVKLFMILFAIDIRHVVWYFRYRKTIVSYCKKHNIHFIYAYCSIADGFLAQTASFVNKLTKLPFAVHYCDPIPSPRKCETYECYRVNVIKPLHECFRGASFLSFNNKFIIENAQQYLPFDIRAKSIIIPDTCTEGKIYEASKSNKFILSYIGRFYTVNRTPDKILKAFERSLRAIPEAQLQFIGSNIELSDYNIPTDIQNRIKIVGWTDELDKYISESDILVDISLDIEEDYFISSKLKSYLSSNKLILSISNDNSATSDFLSGLKTSVVRCNHSIESISRGIEQCRFMLNSEIDFSERDNLVHECKPSTVSRNIIKEIIKHV